MQISHVTQANYLQAAHCEDDLYNLDIELKDKNQSINLQEMNLAESVICPTTWCS